MSKVDFVIVCFLALSPWEIESVERSAANDGG